MKKAVSCAQCGTKMRAGIKFCSKCGYRLKDAAAEAIAEAAQAEAAAANFLTEEEIAALREAEAAPAIEEAVTAMPEESPASPASEMLQKQKAEAEAERQRALDEHHTAMHRQRTEAERKLAQHTAKAEAEIERVNADTDVQRKIAENVTKIEAAKRENARAVADIKAARVDAVSEGKLSGMRIAEEKKLAKRKIEADKKNLRTEAGIDLRDAERAERAERREISARSFDSRLADIRQIGEHELNKKQEKEAIRAERELISDRESDFRRKVKDDRAVARALRAEDRKTAKHQRAEAGTVVLERSSENRLHERRVAVERAKLKQRAVADQRLQSARLDGELKTAKKVSEEQLKATKALLSEEAKISARQNDSLKLSLQEKAFDNKLYAKQAAADRKLRKLRENDVQRVATKQAAIRERETKKLGSLEYKAAAVNLSAEAAEARRQAVAVEREMQKKLREEKLNAREIAAEKRLINQRASDLEKHSRTKTALRMKETRELGRAEMKAIKVAKTEEAIETRRKTDEVKLHIEQKLHEDKLYTKKLAAEKRLIRQKATDADKLQQAEIKNQQMLHEVQVLEDSRATRIKTDDTQRAVTDQKNQNQLYAKKKTADDRIAAREHKLEMQKVGAITARDARVMAMKEKEQKKNLALAERYEKDAVKRAKKISKISGVPVSLVPAVSGESAPSALLTAGGVADGGAPALRDPETLLANSYETNREQYLAYKKKKKKDASRIRYVEIGVRNDRKYFNTLYNNGEIMVAKRTVRIARVQAILAILLILVTLAASLLPIFRLDRGTVVPVEIYDTVLDGTGVVSFESLLTNKQSGGEKPWDYALNLLDRISSDDLLDSIKEGMVSYWTAIKTATDNGTFLANGGKWALFAFLAFAVLLTPILIILNFLIALLRLIFRAFGKGVGITRVMKNLRATYSLLGFVLLPLIFLSKVKIITGFWILIGSFGASILLMFLLNLVKKYEKSDRRYLTLVQLNGLVRLLILAAFFVTLRFSGLFAVSAAGKPGSTMMYVSFTFLALSYLFLGFCSRAVTTFGFEIIGYTKGATVIHAPLVIFGLLGCIFGMVPKFLAEAEISAMIYVSVIAILAILAVTLVFGFVKRIIARRYNLIDPILDALEEGYPLK